jgi:hypothetical protein
MLGRTAVGIGYQGGAPAAIFRERNFRTIQACPKDLPVASAAA